MLQLYAYNVGYISMEMGVTKYSTVRMEKCTNDDNDYKTIETLKIVADTIHV